MRAVPIVVVDKRTGRPLKGEAAQVACPDCEGVTFELFVIGGHNHLRCCNCETSFCQAGEQCTAGLGDDAPEEPADGASAWEFPEGSGG